MNQLDKEIKMYKERIAKAKAEGHPEIVIEQYERFLHRKLKEQSAQHKRQAFI